MAAPGDLILAIVNLLQAIAEILVASVRETDFIVRYGGDEFLVVVPGVTERDLLGAMATQIIGTLECLPRYYRQRVAGFIVNRFRGDLRLFADGVSWIVEILVISESGSSEV